MAPELTQQAYEPKTRPSCPFYGFAPVLKAFLDTRGSQCGLLSMVKGSHTPCTLEWEGKEVSFDSCVHCNNVPNPVALKSILQHHKVYPRELWPEGVKSWSGISFPEWYDLIKKLG